MNVLAAPVIMLRYKEFDHTADIGVEIYGGTREELFQNAGYALFDTIVDAATITARMTRTVSIRATDSETLLLNWLRELLYLFCVHQEVYSEFDIRTLEPTCLEARIHGEALHVETHDFHTELKAVTYHQFTVFREDNTWKARVIFDV